MTNQESLIVLNAINGITAAFIQRITARFENLQDIFQLEYQALLELGCSVNLANNIKAFDRSGFLDKELNLARSKGIDIVTKEDVSYPSELKKCADAPIVLYLKGNTECLKTPLIAMVGSRKSSSYGNKVALEFAEQFARAGYGVISGMALGIDTASHQGALKVGGCTVAVLGCGLNHIYPKENAGLFEQIAKKGLLISEFSINTAPFPFNFPRRNRIISALSCGVVIVEAAKRSGALITIDYALAQQKDIFVVPGNIGELSSEGTNQLIRDGARIVLSAKDVFEDLGVSIQEELFGEFKKEKNHVSLSEEEYKIYEALEQNPTHIDFVATKLKRSVGHLLSEMLHLELKGVVKQLPGGYYVRV